jgi:hypothetical protein
MSILDHPPKLEHLLADLLPQLVSARRRVAELEAAVLAAGGSTAPIALCGHTDRPVAGLLNKQTGLPGCLICVGLSHGMQPKDIAFLLQTQPDPLEWDDRILPFTRPSIWP